MSIIAQDPYEHLVSKANRDYPPSWNFKTDGPLVAGEFVELTFGHTAFGESPIAAIRLQNGKEVSVWVFHSVLKKALARIRPQAGERIVIRQVGEKVSASGTTYMDYKVEVEREDSGDVYDRLEAVDDDDFAEQKALNDTGWEAP